jgi:hypothetical protein
VRLKPRVGSSPTFGTTSVLSMVSGFLALKPFLFICVRLLNKKTSGISLKIPGV